MRLLGGTDGSSAGSWRLSLGALNALLETSADAALLVDDKRVILAVNGTTERYFGYSRSELLGHSADMLVADVARVSHERESGRYGSAPSPLVIGHPPGTLGAAHRKDGTTFPVEVTLGPLRTDAGTLTVATIRDVSERVRAETALREQEERFRASVETILDAFGVYAAVRDPAGRLVDFRVEYVNRAAERLPGLMREERPGQGLRQGLGSHGQEALFDAYCRVVETGEPLACEVRAPSGPRLAEGPGQAFDVRAARFGDGFAATWRDTTPRLQRDEERQRLLAQEHAARVDAEAAQRRLSLLSEAGALLDESLDYETTLQAVVDSIVPAVAPFCALDVVARDGSLRRLVAVSPSLDEAMADALRALAHCAPQPGGPHLSLDALPTARSRLAGDIVREHLNALPQDSPHPDLLRRASLGPALAVPLRAHGRVLGTLLLLWLRRGRPDAQTVALAEDLAGRAAVHLENARLYTDLQEAVRTRDALFALASHDLKSPLATLSLGIDVLRYLDDQREPASEEERRERQERQRRALSQMQTAKVRMLGLVSELMDLAHLQEGRQLSLQRQELDLVALAREYLSSQNRAGHTLRLVAREAPLVGEWDEARITRVLDNLVGNALKYSPRGTTVTITLSREVDGDRAWAVLSVADQGVGIPAGELQRVFERFHRGSNVPAGSAGAGLGLWGARHVVEQHGGTLSVASPDSGGSTFTVRLPLAGSGTSADLEGV